MHTLYANLPLCLGAVETYRISLTLPIKCTVTRETCVTKDMSAYESKKAQTLVMIVTRFWQCLQADMQLMVGDDIENQKQ